MPEYNEAEAKKWQDEIDKINSLMAKLNSKLETMAPGNPEERKQLRAEILELQKQLKESKEELAEWKAKSKERHKTNTEELTQKSPQDPSNPKPAEGDNPDQRTNRRAAPRNWL